METDSSQGVLQEEEETKGKTLNRRASDKENFFPHEDIRTATQGGCAVSVLKVVQALTGQSSE